MICSLPLANHWLSVVLSYSFCEDCMFLSAWALLMCYKKTLRKWGTHIYSWNGPNTKMGPYPTFSNVALTNTCLYLLNLALLCLALASVALPIYYDIHYHIISMGCWCFQLQLQYGCPLFSINVCTLSH